MPKVPVSRPSASPVKRPVKKVLVAQTPRAPETAAPYVKPSEAQGASKDLGQHLAMLTDLEMFSMNPDDAMIVVDVKIGERQFKQAIDEVYALRWDNARKRFNREELAKHMSRCAFYSATFLVAATEASSELEKLENFYEVWVSGQRKEAEDRIREQRKEEMAAKQRKEIGQITGPQVEAEICTDEKTQKVFLGWKEKIRQARANKDMMKGLYTITQNAGSYLQTLARMYNVEDVAGHRMQT